MPVVVYLASFGVVSSLFLFRWAVSGNSRSSRVVRANLGARVISNAAIEDSPSQRMAKRIDKIPLIKSTATLNQKIATAGLSWRAANVQLIKVGSIVLSVLFALLVLVSTSSLLLPGLLLLCGVAGALAPEALIASRAERRQQELERELPDLLDRLTISMEAGLGFDSALAHVVVDQTGPCHDEFRRVLQDLQLGVPRDVALASLGERTTVPDLRLVVASIIQSGAYGLPLANVLRVQTTELRDKRWARAQERALKIPVKVLFPVIFCILPALFVVLIGPGILRIAKAF